MIHIYSFVFNALEENTFVLYNDKGECIIIDPGMENAEEEKQFLNFIRAQNLKPVRLINTHTHLDHILGNHFIHKTYGLKPEYHVFEDKIIHSAPIIAENMGIPYSISPLAEQNLLEGEKIYLGDHEIICLFTPGHSPGHLSFYIPDIASIIGGDAIFRLSIGRTDIPFGNYEQLIESIHRNFGSLPPETIIYPGHGISTQIGYEMDHNPFLMK